MSDNEKYMIFITSEQIIDDDSDQMEVLTGGNFYIHNEKYYISYKEYDETSPEDFYSNLVKIENDIVTITRKGTMSSQLMLEKGKRHQCIYQTIAGNLTIGVYTKTMKNKLNENGGTLEVSYTLDFNTGLVSENKFLIKVTPKENNNENEVI